MKKGRLWRDKIETFCNYSAEHEFIQDNSAPAELLHFSHFSIEGFSKPKAHIDKKITLTTNESPFDYNSFCTILTK